MHYDKHRPTNGFLDSLASNSYFPYVIQPSWLRSHSRTLTNKISSNAILKDIILGNITATISNHLTQFFISLNTFANLPANKYNVFERDWSKFDQETFIWGYFDIDWFYHLNLHIKMLMSQQLISSML